jgi:hypothetical protein
MMKQLGFFRNNSDVFFDVIKTDKGECMRRVMFLFLCIFLSTRLIAQETMHGARMRAATDSVSDKPMLELKCFLPDSLRYDSASGSFQPNPFTVRLICKNVGNTTASNVSCELQLPPYMEFSPPGQAALKYLSPSTLNPYRPGDPVPELRWTVQYTGRVRKDHALDFFFEAGGVDVKGVPTDTAVTRCMMVVPGVQPTDSSAAFVLLLPQCFAPDSLHYNDPLDAYEPNPFTVRLTCVNVGNAPASHVSGELFLPPDVTIVPFGENARQYFTPSTLWGYHPGDPVPELSWTVQFLKRYRTDQYPEFHFRIGGVDSTDAALDSADVYCTVRVPGTQPALHCALSLPDSLTLNADGTGYVPNPFPVIYTLSNDGSNTGYVKQITLQLAAADSIVLDASSPNPLRFDFTPPLRLYRHTNKTFTWMLRAAKSLVWRYVSATVTAVDEEDKEVTQPDGQDCRGSFSIPPIPTCLNANLTTSAALLHYSTQTGRYDPADVVLISLLNNCGGANLKNVFASLAMHDTLGLLEFDPAFPDNSNPKTWPLLLPGANQNFRWGLHLRKFNSTGVIQTVRFSIGYGSDETPKFVPWTGPDASVDIEPVSTTAVDHPTATRFELYQNIPNPYSTSTVIEYTLGQETDYEITVFDKLGRKVLTLSKGRATAGKHSVVFDGTALPSGVYLYKLETPAFSKVMRMALLK